MVRRDNKGVLKLKLHLFLLGKPIVLARTGELELVLTTLRYFAGWADKIHGKTIEGLSIVLRRCRS